MRVWRNEQGHVFAAVENYPNVDSMIDGTNHVGTVAMEFSPGPDGGEPYTKFYTFVRDPQSGVQKRVGSMDFDGRGEKFTPGNCTVCHGGTPAALQAGVYPAQGNIGAGFLLWDIETFLFSDAEYEGRAPLADTRYTLSKDDQQDEFKVFNETLLLTNINDAQRDIIYGWYGGETLPNATLNAQYVPAAWRSPAEGGPETNPDTASEFYLNVFAPTCRACHLSQQTEALRFASYEAFFELKDDILHSVFDEGTMPLARVTMDNFWLGTPAETAAGLLDSRAQALAEHFSVDQNQRRLGSPKALIRSEVISDDIVNALPGSNEESLSVVLRGDRIDASAMGSVFAEVFSWSLERPDNSEAVLSNRDQPASSFVTDTHGDFTLNLNIDDGQGRGSQATYIYRVENRLPVAGDFEASIKEGQLAEINVLASPTTLGDGNVDEHDVVEVSLVSGGRVDIGEGGQLTFTPSGSGSASFEYQISDVDGDESGQTGEVSIVISALPAAANDSLTASIGTLSSRRQISIVENDILGNDSLGVEPSQVVAIERIPVTLSNGLNTCSGVSGSLSYVSFSELFSYTPPVACAGVERYDYTLRDNNGDESTARISITVSRTPAGAFASALTAISNGGCSGCHNSSNVLDLSGSSSAKWAELTECNLSPSAADCAGFGARINAGSPANSVLLQKALGNLGHSGGASFANTSDPDYLRLLRWIEEGAAP
jgi:hypothetical protein